MSNAYKLAESQGKIRRSGKGFMINCPIHDDKNASLWVVDGEQNSIIFTCHAGCNSQSIAHHFNELGFNVYKDNNEQSISQKHKEIARYQYISSDGQLLFEKIRFEPKGFMIVNPSGPGDGGNKGSLYNAQNLFNLKDKIVYIVEGEKDVDYMSSIGLLACTSGGSSNWPDKNNHLFDGAIVRILPDNDEPGKKYAKLIRESLEGIANSIKIMFCPEQYKDVSDWKPTTNQIDELFNQHKFKTISFNKLLELDLTTNWLIKDYFEEGGIFQIFGSSGSGKSFFALDAAYCASTGLPFFGKQTKKCNVMYIAGEGFPGLKKRAKALKDKYEGDILSFEFSMQAAQLMSEESCIDVADRIKANGGFDLLFIDTLNRNMGGGDENSTQDMTRFISNIDKHIRSLGCAVVIVHHSGLMNKERARGSSAVYNAIDAEFRIEKNESIVKVTCTKQKEGESGWVKELTLKPVIVGMDNLGEAVYSCVLLDETAEPEVLKAREQSVYDALRQCCIECGEEMEIEGVTVYPVDIDLWKDYAYKRLNNKNQRRDFTLAKDILIQKSYVFLCSKGYYFL
jgi:5S rRNA maturation endonuclease (ribonuclease M5)